MSEQIKTELRGNVGIIYLNRPHSLNAWTATMQKLCFEALKDMEKDSRVRVIVLTGKGRAFCAGADMSGLNDMASSGTLPVDDKSEASSRLDVLFPTTILKPIIAAINGSVAGMGLALALACDIRFAASDAKMVSSFSRRGLVAEWGTSWTLPRLVGTGNAMMFLLGSDVFCGEDALRMGIVQRCFPKAEVLNRTVEFAQHLADKASPVSMTAMKLQIWRSHTQTLDEAKDDAFELMKLSLSPANADFKEGVTSFFQKRPAKFGALDENNPVVKRAITKLRARI